jgi:cation:H+ antiporter
MDLAEMGLALNLAIFVVAGIAVWVAGTRMSGYADEISKKTGLGQALIGLLLLAGVTSLPEIGVSVTAAASGNADLAVNNLFGSIAMQVAILAVIDFVIGRRALTSVVPDPGLLLLGTLNVLLLSIAAAGMVVGDIAFVGIGLWAWASLAAYIFSLWLLSQTQGRRPWLATDLAGGSVVPLDEPAAEGEDDEGFAGVPRAIIVRVIIAAAVILVAGYALAQSGDAIAEQTGLGSSFVGFVLVAVSTSLPEFSTALGAARLGRFTMAISDILGTNLINIGLLFVVDAVAAGEPVLNAVGSFSVFGAILGVIVTTLFLAGLAERRDRTIFRLGIDSAAVLVVYLGGLVILYALR